MSRFTIDEARELLSKAGLFYYDLDDDDPEVTKEDKQTLNMNDTWLWGSAWGYPVKDEDLPELARLFWNYGWCGVLYWVSINNENMKSEFYHYNRMIEFVAKEEEISKKCKSLSEYAYKKESYCVRGRSE